MASTTLSHRTISQGKALNFAQPSDDLSGNGFELRSAIGILEEIA
ncbi:hypothetical protein [Pseudanabaena minima]